MLDRTQVVPFTRVEAGHITVDYLREADGRVHAFLDRVLRLTQRLEGRPRRMVIEALRRQERRVRDVARLSGIARTVIDGCVFRAPAGAARAAEVRDALFTARGSLWPPLPGDERLPYETAALMLDLPGADEVARILFADSPAERLLARAPRIDAPTLLDRYNINLARGVLLDAVRVSLTARGGWRGVFRAVKLARLMYTIERVGRTRRTYRLTLTGPASPWLVRPQRYGSRFARIMPALVRAPGWRIRADVVRDGHALTFDLDAATLPVRRRRGRTRFDSRFEQALAADFAARIGAERDGWSLTRENTPVTAGDTLFLPDFTLRHRDGREALVEIIGFWTPEYLSEKLRKLHATRSDVILVVYRGLASGATDAAIVSASDAPVVWFRDRPRIGPVMEAVERFARVPDR